MILLLIFSLTIILSTSIVSATEENESLNTTNSCQTGVEDQTDNQTSIDNQSNSTTTQYAAAGSVTFTQDQIIEANTWVKNYIETNQELPDNVTINGINVSMPSFLELLTTLTLKINNSDTTNIEYYLCGNATAPKDSQKKGTMNLTKYIEIAGKVKDYMDRNLVAPNYSSYSNLGTYFGYENLVYTYSKIISAYNNTGTLPTTVSIVSWSFFVNYAGTFTINQTIDAATWVKEYIETNQKLPDSVTIIGTNLQGATITKEITMPVFLELLATVTLKINNNDTKSTDLLSYYQNPQLPKEEIHSGNISLSKYIEIAGRVKNYMDLNLVAPNYSSYSGLGSYFGYENLVYTYSKVISAYNSTGALPTTMSINPWNRFTWDQVASAATDVKTYVNNNHQLPSYVTIKNVKVGMSSFLKILTSTILNINGNLTESAYYNYCASADSPRDSQTSGQMDLDGYLLIAGKVKAYMDTKWTSPNYSSYSSLGTYFGPANMVYTFSRVMAYYGEYDALPSSVGVGPWWGTVTFLGSTSYGNVVKIGPFGNIDSSVKIAYIIGVHPLEKSAHQAILQSIKKYDTSLNYCYYIYQITVTKDASNYEKGRLNGQLLAKYLVVPDITKKKYKLAVDIHNNVGNWAKTRFIFSPVSGTTAETIAWKIKNKISGLYYYYPPNPTSTQYITIPLIKGGIPAVIYESYYYASYGTVCNQADQFVLTVDSLSY